MDYRDIIKIEPGKRGGRSCVRGRGLRIAVADVLGCLAAGIWDKIRADGDCWKLVHEHLSRAPAAG